MVAVNENLRWEGGPDVQEATVMGGNNELKVDVGSI